MATIRDIAKEAGVSPGAVSRILNNDATLSVSPETRQNVFEIAKKLNYNKPQKNIRTEKAAFTMGIVQWFSAEEELKDNYYLLTRQGIEDFCIKNAIAIVRVFPGQSDAKKMLEHVDGLVCIGKFSQKEVQEFIKICHNTVFLDMPVAKYNITSLSMDFEQAVYEALDYLTNLGHTHIGFLGGVEYVGNHELVKDARTASYKKYMKHRHMDYKTYFKEGHFTSQSGYEMMEELLESGNVPTAIFAASDAIAFGAMRAIREHQLRIPEDISIIGFNDEETCAYMNPPLTTIHAPAYDMGQHGANLVYVASNLSIHTPLKAKIPCKLVVRNSCTNHS
ncbi:MAG: LacI family DNA-binding transcriptional regulator [Lachnospiraceae bacterium]